MSTPINIPLEDVDAAIRAAILGKSYTLPDGQSVTRQDLSALRELRREIQAQLVDAGRDGFFCDRVGFGSD